MTSYEALSRHYDAFTQDVPYEKWLSYTLRHFRRLRLSPRLILDLCCGTGTISSLLSCAGYDVIGVDASADMLCEAADKPAGTHTPLFLCQRMERLQLHGPVDAAVCFLDSINHITKEKTLRAALTRIYDSLRPGGVFMFDIVSPAALAALDAQCFVRENEEAFCTYRAAFSKRTQLLHYTVDLFEENGGAYLRASGEHSERAWRTDELESALSDAGFARTEWFGELSMSAPRADEGRLFCVAQRAHAKDSERKS